MARGQWWKAAYIDACGEVNFIKVCAGTKLQQLIRKHFPTFNPYLSSTATVKDQGSSISVVDDDIYVRLVLTSDLVETKHAHRNPTTKRPAKVKLSNPDWGWLWGDSHTVYLPTEEAILTCREHFSDHSFPSEEWFESDCLEGYRVLNIFSGGAESQGQARRMLLSLVGWPQSSRESGDGAPKGSRVFLQYE